jgi:hypothetical protein
MGAITVKWIVPNMCLVLGESDSKLYAKFVFCKENYRHFKNKLLYKAKKIMMTEKIIRKVYIF